MYKTVRHGENSLQYTILPQQDESTGSTSNHKTSSGLCRGRSSHRTKRGRTTTILIVTLILVCSIVAGSILVPLLMTTDMVAFRKLTSSSQASTPHVVVHRHHATAAKVVHVTTTTSTTTTATSTAATTPEDNFNTLTTGTHGDVVNKAENSSLKASPDDLVVTADAEGEGTPSTPQETSSGADVTTPPASPQKPKKANETGDEGGGDVNGTVTMLRAVGTTRIVVEATVAAGGGERNWTEGPEVVIAKVTRPTTDPYRGWLPPRWPFADPSSYLQWTGYGSGHDSLLLPLLLGLVLIVLLLVLVFCYVMRRKHQKYLRREAIGKMSSDLQCDEAGDKSTLLQETNSEEE